MGARGRMTRNLGAEERRKMDQRIAAAEKRTGSQIVIAVIERCDDYPELPWKAFALGASVGGLAVVLVDFLHPAWSAFAAVLLAAAAVLGAGAVLALLSVSLPDFARLFLDEARAEVEARQYAESLFLSRELFATRGRSGILLLVGLFEREVVVLPDSGLRSRLGRDVLEGIIARMTPHLAAGRIAGALDAGLAGLEEVLAGAAPAPAGGNELPDGIIEEKGA